MEHAATASLQIKAVQRRAKSRIRKQLIRGLLFTSPVLLGYAIFILIPLILTIVFSFMDYSIGSSKNEFIGLDNYKSMFTGQERFFFFPAIKATFYYVAVSVPLGIVFSFFVAVLLNQKVRGLGLFRSIFYLPVVIPLASTTLIWIWILQPNFGIANYLLQSVGLPPSTFLSSDTTFIPTLILFSIWLCGSTIIIFLAGLQSIPSHLYESIEIDGGNSWHKMLYVTIPLSSSVIFMNTVIGFINALQTFVQPTLMGGTAGTTTAGATGGPDLSGFLYVLYIFQSAFRFSRMGAASAAAVILIIVSIVLTYLIFKFSKSMVYYEGDGKNK